MSTLKVNTIQNASGVEVYTAKAWVNFNGTGTVAIRAAGNVSSITDNGTGNYTVNFTAAMPDANYCPVVGASPAFGVASIFQMSFANNGGTESAPTTGSLRLSLGDTTALRDPNYVSVAIFR